MDDSYDLLIILFMRDIEKTTWPMEEEDQYIVMEKYMKDSGLMAKLMDMEFIYIQMVHGMKVNGKPINSMDMGLKYELTVLFFNIFNN